VLKIAPFLFIVRWWQRRSADAQGFVRGGALAAALFGAWVASVINANTIETLHFRHIWLFLAVVCALDPETARQEWESERTQEASPRVEPSAAVAT
jgi:uncharacterized membrane protein YfcA